MFEPGRPICIVNPQSAGGRTGQRWPRLRFEMQSRLGPIDSLLTSSRGEAIGLAREAASKGATLVVAVGGDGTVNEVVNGLMQVRERAADLTLALLPAGTGGDLARSLRVAAGSRAALEAIAAGRRRPLDVGRVEFPGPDRDPPERYFANIASVGLEGVVDRRMDQAPRLLGGRFAYLWATVGAGISYRPARVVLRSGSLELSRTVVAVVLANGRFFGGGMEIAPSARLDDGRLELVLLRAAPLWRLALEAPRLYNGSIYQAPFVEHARVTELEAVSEDGRPVLLGIDGEPIGSLPARFSIVPSALQVIVGEQ